MRKTIKEGRLKRYFRRRRAAWDMLKRVIYHRDGRGER